jgi:hypothetical protein
LVLFSIAIPFLAAHFFISKIMDESTLPVTGPASVSSYLAKVFETIFIIGVLCTGFGIASALANSSLVVTDVFLASCAFIIAIATFIQKDYNKAINIKMENMKMETSKLKLEKEKMESEIRNLELEREKLELEHIKRQFERGKLEFERGKLELEKRNLELKLASTIKH